LQAASARASLRKKPGARCQRYDYTGAYAFANVLLTVAGSVILLLWGAGMVFIGHVDCGRGCGGRLVLSIMAALVVIT
jgi:hypothetical protein